MRSNEWRSIAARQAGMLSRAQLRELGIDRWAVRNRVTSQRWATVSSSVIATTTGKLTREQLMWTGVLHTDGPALVGDLAAAEVLGLKNWYRDDITIVVPRGAELGQPIPGVRFVETRRDLQEMATSRLLLPLMRLEPAVLHFAAYQRSTRTAEGVVAAVVQQQLCSPAGLLRWIDTMQPLRWAHRLRHALNDIGAGAQSVAEIDVRRMCRRYGFALPHRQVKRRDRSGRVRYTDCEWHLADGRTLLLEVDGWFHMTVEHWEDDIQRQRALTATDQIVVRCTSRELRDESHRVARDLQHLGIPRAAA